MTNEAVLLKAPLGMHLALKKGRIVSISVKCYTFAAAAFSCQCYLKRQRTAGLDDRLRDPIIFRSLIHKAHLRI